MKKRHNKQEKPRQLSTLRVLFMYTEIGRTEA